MDGTARVRALVVDDNATNRLILQVFLEEMMGFEVTEASDGAMAVDIYRKASFDLVFMDIEMPVMNGLAATGAIRLFEDECGLVPAPIIVVSAFCDTHDQMKSHEAGATCHVAKPIALNALREVVEEIQAGSRLLAQPFAALRAG